MFPATQMHLHLHLALYQPTNKIFFRSLRIASGTLYTTKVMQNISTYKEWHEVGIKKRNVILPFYGQRRTLLLLSPFRHTLLKNQEVHTVKFQTKNCDHSPKSKFTRHMLNANACLIMLLITGSAKSKHYIMNALSYTYTLKRGLLDARGVTSSTLCTANGPH